MIICDIIPLNYLVMRLLMFNYEIIKSLNDMELLVYDYLMKNKEKIETDK